MNTFNMIVTVLGGLALFLFGMKVMSEGLQKVAGPKMRTILSKMTGNRFSGVFTGFGVTCAVQSSSVTTVMLVSFVSAGMITLTESIGVVMGANIGTTFTGWLVALLGFKFEIILLAFPAIIVGFLPKIAGIRRLEDWGEVLLGFGILFLGLDFMKDSVHQLRESPTLISALAAADASAIGHRLIAVLIGAAVTMVVQSSSATMAITLTLAAQGLIGVDAACALVLGENIGTTMTANLAAISANKVAKQTARAHFVFNMFGALWGVVLFTPFVHMIDWMVPGDLLGASVLSKATLAAHIAMFHSMFNIINTSLFLPFVKPLAWLSTNMVWGTKDDDRRVAIQYLDTHLIDSPPLALHATRQEFKRMIEEVETMHLKVRELIGAPGKKLGEVAAAISASEQVVDHLEKEITEYLVAVTRVETSEEQSHEIAGLINSVSDVERMGDHCEALHRLLSKRYDKKIEQTEEAKKQLMEISEKVSEFIALVLANLDEPGDSLMIEAKQIETAINAMRKRMRKRHIDRLNNGECSVNAGLIFIDMLTSFEKMGDHAYNVAQVLAGDR